MEEAIKDQSPTPATANIVGRPSSKLLRYPLRSETKSKEEKTPVAESANSSAPKRGKPAASVSKSMGVLDLSGKEKSAKPPRRLSIPAKSTASPVPKPVGNITPISEVRAKRSINSRGNSDTPVTDVSKSSNRKKFSVLSSASYWLSQIKLSESASKHSISLGLFKLAVEAGCEPLQRMRDELISYACRHNLVDFGECAKELFESYNILESFEQLQVSETCSHVLEEGTRSSNDNLHSSSSFSGNRKLKPKSLNTDTHSPVKESAKEITQKKNPITRGLVNKNSANSKSGSEAEGCKTQKKSQKSSMQESNKKKDMVKRQGKKIPQEGSINPSPAEEVLEENKENMEAPQIEEIILAEA